jgi:hypothetical protein
MGRSLSLIGVLSSKLLGVGALQAWAQTTKPSAGWTPDPAILKQLGAAVQVEKYTLRVPNGYEMQQAKNTPASMKAWGWTGAARKDGSKPSVTLTMVELPAEQIEKTNVARDGHTIVQIASQDVTPETTKTLPLAETSVLTFKKM